MKRNHIGNFDKKLKSSLMMAAMNVGQECKIDIEDGTFMGKHVYKTKGFDDQISVFSNTFEKGSSLYDRFYSEFIRVSSNGDPNDYLEEQKWRKGEIVELLKDFDLPEASHIVITLSQGTHVEIVNDVNSIEDDIIVKHKIDHRMSVTFPMIRKYITNQ